MIKGLIVKTFILESKPLVGAKEPLLSERRYEYRFLIEKNYKIPSNPYQYRKSIYFENESIRDLIFKGYTVVFRITAERIEVFGFVKYQKEPED